ncbi:MAG: hypothetical protein HPY53_04100 [Brevinematales bacterium]|nr:hypothetical protein [Brevinematales bacterium]
MSEKRKRINTADLLREKQNLIESIKSKLHGETPSKAIRTDEETGMSLKPDFTETAETPKKESEPITVTLPKDEVEPIIISPPEVEVVPVTVEPPKEEPAPVTVAPEKKESEPAAPFTPKVSPTAVKPAPVEKESTASESPEDSLKKLIGKWTVVSHTTSGDDYRLYFEMSHLNGQRFKSVTMSETFDFNKKGCLKETDIGGVLDDDRSYRYRLTLNTTFRIPREGILEITVESGRLSLEFGGEPASVKEYIGDGKSDETGFRFHGETLILEDVYRDDKKKLAKIRE